MQDAHDILVKEVVHVAGKVAATFEQVTLLQCPDAETQRVVMPDQPDPALQARLDTAIATALVAAGTELAVQVVDRAAYLAWLDGHQSTRDWRIGYRDPARLVRGAAALDLLGVAPSAARPSRMSPPPRRQGSPADRLVHAWVTGHPGFDQMLGALLNEGRQGVIDMAVHKVSETYLDEAIDDFLTTVEAAAEATDLRPGTWAELFAVAAFLAPDVAALPDPAPVTAGLKTSGQFSAGVEVLVPPLWFDPDAIASLTPCAVRKTLSELAGGRTPSLLTPVTAAQEAVVLLGVTVDDFPIPWEEAVEALGADDAAAPEPYPTDPVLEMRNRAFDAWRETLLASTPDLVDVLLPTPLSHLADDIEDAADPEEHEVRDYIETARAEAGGEEIVCVPRIAGEQVELSLYTVSGRLLDSRTFGKAESGQLPVRLQAAVAAVVPIVDQPPGG
jgi:hypothetical protein